jgi:hypothetical protein
MGSSPEAAVLLVHGMGQQNRYETLLNVARSISRRPEYTVKPIADPRRGGLDRGIRVEKECEPVADLYEYYWAPKTAGKIGVTQTLLWFVKQSVPRRNQLAKRTSAAAGWKTALNALLFIVAAALVALVAIAAANWAKASIVGFTSHEVGLDHLSDSWEATWTALNPDATACTSNVQACLELFNPFNLLPTGESSDKTFGQLLADGVVLLVSGGVIAYLAVQAIRFAVLLFSTRPTWESIFPDSAPPPQRSGWYRWRALGFAVLFSAAGLAALYYTGSAAVAVLAVLLAWMVRYVLTVLVRDLLGDVVAYLDRDEKAEWYEARRQIMDEGLVLYGSLLGLDIEEDFASEQDCEPKDLPKASDCPRYSKVVVVGHSLGSVIALDLLRQFSVNVKTYADSNSQARLRESLSAFITVGSPLGYVAYVYGRSTDNVNRLGFLFTETLRQIFDHQTNDLGQSVLHLRPIRQLVGEAVRVPNRRPSTERQGGGSGCPSVVARAVPRR